MKIKRIYNLEQYIKKGKVLLIYGPRQVGKTTLIKDYLKTCEYKYRYDTGDNQRIQNILATQDLSIIKEYLEGYNLIVLDEAQRIPNIGWTLKLIVDNFPEIAILATGSSSFELAGQVGEPLTGRKKTLQLFGISHIELKDIYNNFDLKEQLEQYILYGTYPEVITSKEKNEKISLLHEMTDSYLLKDILELDKVKNSKVLLDILKMLALQIGKEVSLREISNQIGIDHKTVAKYIDLFEKTFIIFNVRGFSRNLRNEIKNKSKYYFYDNGIRNAIISNFNSLDIRNDKGELWENFLFMERLKKRTYTSIYSNYYFWRTWQQKEIDLIEEFDGKIYAYEFKWKNKQAKVPKEFSEAYNNSEFQVIHTENYLEFIL
jgi:uncharacterized protein